MEVCTDTRKLSGNLAVSQPGANGGSAKQCGKVTNRGYDGGTEPPSILILDKESCVWIIRLKFDRFLNAADLGVTHSYMEVEPGLVPGAVFKTVEPYVKHAVGGFDSHALPPFSKFKFPTRIWYMDHSETALCQTQSMTITIQPKQSLLCKQPELNSNMIA